MAYSSDHDQGDGAGPLCYDASQAGGDLFPVHGRPVGGGSDPSTKIVRILIDYRPALRHRTGVGLWVARLVDALARLGSARPDLTVFSSSWKDRLTTTLPPGVRRVDRRVPVQYLNWLWHRHEWPPVELLAPGPFDVVHSPTPLMVPTRSAARVVTIHDVDFLTHRERGVREIRRDYARLAHAHAHRADVVVVPSHYTGEQVAARLDLSPERIVVCPNGPPGWPKRADTPRPKHLLFVGTISARKNIDRLLDAYARLRATQPQVPPLVLAGQLSPDDAAVLAPLDQPPLAGHVRHEGYVDDQRLRVLYEQAVEGGRAHSSVVGRGVWHPGARSDGTGSAGAGRTFRRPAGGRRRGRSARRSVGCRGTSRGHRKTGDGRRTVSAPVRGGARPSSSVFLAGLSRPPQSRLRGGGRAPPGHLGLRRRRVSCDPCA